MPSNKHKLAGQMTSSVSFVFGAAVGDDTIDEDVVGNSRRHEIQPSSSANASPVPTSRLTHASTIACSPKVPPFAS